LTEDGLLVMPPEPTLYRTARSRGELHGLVIEKTLAQVQARDAGTWSNERLPQYARPAYAGLRVLTPDELLARYGDCTGYCSKMFHELESVAGVASIDGRGCYGVRRIAADVAEDVEKDERVLNSITGHRDSTRWRMVYQDRERPEMLNRAAKTRQAVRRSAVAGAKQPPPGAALQIVPKARTA
jgi:integrase